LHPVFRIGFILNIPNKRTVMTKIRKYSRIAALMLSVAASCHAAELVFDASEAELETEGPMAYREGPDKIGMWTSPAETIRWTADLPKAGLYQPILEVACDPNYAYSQIELEIAGEKQLFIMPPTDSWDDFVDHPLDPMALPAGEVEIVLHPVTIRQHVAGDVRSLTLMPVDASEATAAEETQTGRPTTPATGDPSASPNEATVTSSAMNQAAQPYAVIDGGKSFWRLPAGEQTVTLDLGHAVPIENVIVEWSPLCAETFEIQLSLDGRNFETVERVTGLSVPKRRRMYVNRPGERKYQLNEPREARYIRLQLHRAAQPDKGYELIELQVNDAVPICYEPVPQDAPIFDPQADPAVRLEDLLERMTFREKLHLAGGYNAFLIPGFARFGLDPVLLNDTTAGLLIRNLDKHTATEALEKSTSFPPAAAMAATWNPLLVAEVADAIGEECRAHGTGILLGPGMNIHRTSICGRNFEYFSEDPFLSARMGVAYINALQAQGIIATAKHLIANNNEFIRHRTNVIVDERALHEIYLPAFKAAVQEADVRAIMSSYNWLNGEKCGEDEILLTDILRDELGYDGFVMSDWTGTYDRTKVPGSGQNLIMPNKIELFDHAIRQYADDPTETEALIEAMIRPTAEVLLETGVWDRAGQSEPERRANIPGHKTVARRTAEEAITLLKNDGALPLDPSTPLLVTGTGEAVLESSSGLGSGFVKGYDHINYLDGLNARFDEVVYSPEPSDAELREAGAVLFFFETGDRENFDHPFEMPVATVEAIRRAAALNDRVIVLASSGTAFEMQWLDDVEGLVHCYYLGQERGNALAAVLSGDVTPSGKLPFTMERRYLDSPAWGDNAINGELVWGGNDQRFLEQPFYDVHYAEGIFVGYRWYEAEEKPVNFPFGYGLSYTSFAIEDAQVDRTTIAPGQNITVRATVTNTGEVAGAEVVQCYVHDEEASVPRPYRELKAFQKVFLEPGESATVTLELDPASFAFWDVDADAWTVEPGRFRLLLGNSSQNVQKELDVRAETGFTL